MAEGDHEASGWPILYKAGPPPYPFSIQLPQHNSCLLHILGEPFIRKSDQTSDTLYRNMSPLQSETGQDEKPSIPMNR